MVSLTTLTATSCLDQAANDQQVRHRDHLLARPDPGFPGDEIGRRGSGLLAGVASTVTVMAIVLGIAWLPPHGDAPPLHAASSGTRP